MTDRLVTRACEIQKQKMTALLVHELSKTKDTEVSVVDLSKLFPRRDERERVEETF